MSVVIPKKFVSGGGGDSPLRVEYFDLNAIQAANKEVFLQETPADASKVILNIVSGSIQKIDVDFKVDGNRVYWDGFGLETILDENDTFVITYDV